MSNVINQLLESANPWQSMQSDAQRLSKKWAKSGLLEGIKTEVEKNSMSVILENQAKQLVFRTINRLARLYLESYPDDRDGLERFLRWAHVQYGYQYG